MILISFCLSWSVVKEDWNESFWLSNKSDYGRHGLNETFYQLRKWIFQYFRVSNYFMFVYTADSVLRLEPVPVLGPDWLVSHTVNHEKPWTTIWFWFYVQVFYIHPLLVIVASKFRLWSTRLCFNRDSTSILHRQKLSKLCPINQ